MAALCLFCFSPPVVFRGCDTILVGVTYEQRSTYKEEKMKDYKALFFIHLCVYEDNLEKVGDYTTSKVGNL